MILLMVIPPLPISHLVGDVKGGIRHPTMNQFPSPISIIPSPLFISYTRRTRSGDIRVNDLSSFFYYTVLAEFDCTIRRDDMYGSSRMNYTSRTERDCSSNIAILSYKSCGMCSDVSIMSSNIPIVDKKYSRGTRRFSCHDRPYVE
jgi:hypothetical protein